MVRPKVIFVGSFLERAKDGSVGGQMFACRSLIKSKLSQKVEFITIDSTSESVPPPPVRKRFGNAFKRLVLFSRSLFVKRVRSCLIFSADGLSFVEKGFMALLARLLRKKVIFAPRSGLIKEDVSKSYFMKKYISFVLKNVDIVICQSNEWKCFYERITDQSSDKFIVQYNWIDEEPYLNSQPHYINKSDGEILNILYLGWIEEFKGILDLIQAISILIQDFTNFHLYVYGSGSLIQKTMKLVKDLELDEFVSFKGWANFEQKLSAFKNTDIYVLPSHFEGFPNSLLEAMVSELPVIATKVGGVKELVTDMENGLLVEKQMPEALAEALLFLMRNKKKRIYLAQNARKTILDKFTVDTAAENLGRILL